MSLQRLLAVLCGVYFLQTVNSKFTPSFSKWPCYTCILFTNTDQAFLLQVGISELKHQMEPQLLGTSICILRCVACKLIQSNLQFLHPCCLVWSTQVTKTCSILCLWVLCGVRIQTWMVSKSWTDWQTDNFVYGGLIPTDHKPTPSHLLTSPRGPGEIIKKNRSEIKNPKGRDKDNVISEGNGKETKKINTKNTKTENYPSFLGHKSNRSPLAQ